MSKPIFIVGMYKSGTSWLLAALSAHPNLIGLREIDIVKAVCRYEGDRLVARTPRERIEQFFGSSSWCSLDREFLDRKKWRTFLSSEEKLRVPGDIGFADLPADIAIQLLLRMRSATVNNKLFHNTGTVGRIVIRAGDENRRNTSQPLSFVALDEASLIELFEKVRAPVPAETVLHSFLDLLGSNLAADARLVLKGADQISGIDFIDRHVAGAKKIVIVRDGRDAALSARHYRKLVEKRSMAWSEGKTGISAMALGWRPLLRKAVWQLRNWLGFYTRLDFYFTLLSWQRRVKRVLAYSRENDIYVVRYEDLTDDFDNTMTAMLSWLNLRCNTEILAEIKARSSFETMTGRERGESADAVARKGQVGEWSDVLSDFDKFVAWRLVGRSLTALGYTIDGKINPCPEVSA